VLGKGPLLHGSSLNVMKTLFWFGPLFALGLLSPARARAEEGWSLRAEAGGGPMLSSHQREQLGFGWGGQGGLRLGYSPVEPLAVQLAASHWMFPEEAGWGKVTLLGAGLRLEPRLRPGMRLTLEADAGLGITGPFERFGFDVAVGLEMAASPTLGFGPVLRYGQVVTGSGDVPTDAKFMTLGILLALRPAPIGPAPVPPPPLAPDPDSDGDGVLDRDDICPQVPKGDHPDPARPGCPRSDADGDGVFDDQDRCPTTPAGPTPDPERLGCPDSDDDNDRVLNQADQCRTVHQGINPDPARPGCPLPDRDNDSVPDQPDACPDQPGAPDPDPKKNGCPGLVRVEQTQIVINRPVYFATLKDRILPRSFPVLKAVAEALRALPEIRLVAIEGHTDSQGKDAFNADLSQRRAASVMKFLIEQGIDAGRLKAIGHGESKPVASNKTAAGRAQNRRVEFNILDPAPAPAPAVAP
jgi:outer membrane protein OmpA-like peptidoglycan-associated protein